MSKHCFLRRHPGEGTPMILAIVLVLLMLFCTVAEFSRVWIIAQGVKEAAQQAVISTINDNYDDVYHAVREGYAGLIQIDGDYYYVNSYCKVITSQRYWVSKTNNLLPATFYTFGADGKMVR